MTDMSDFGWRTPEARAYLRLQAEHLRDMHDAAKQDHNYERCEHCGFTRHPCDVFDLADSVIQFLRDNGAPARGIEPLT